MPLSPLLSTYDHVVLDLDGCVWVGDRATRKAPEAIAQLRAAHKSLAKKGRQILIAAIRPVVEFNIFEFYRGRHTYVGIDTLALSSIETGDVLRNLLPGFESGALRPFAIEPSSAYPLTKAREAYRAVMGSARSRVLFEPKL